MISGADEDGRVMVEFSEPVSGRVVKSLTPEEINGMLYKEETAENPADMTEENPTGEQDTEQERGTTEESAFERIPKDEEGNPQYTQTDAPTAWDAIVEQTEGDEDMARSVVDSTVRDKEAALKKLESSNPKPGATVAEKIAAKEHKAAIEAARQELEQWKAIAEVENSRKVEEGTKAEAERETKANAEEERRKKFSANMGSRYSLSDEYADNGEAFVKNEKGGTNLIEIPHEIFDRLGISPLPFKLTESMALHVYSHHAKELKLKTLDDAIDFVLSTIGNADHVRLGRDNSYVFSVENGKDRVGKRAITIVIGDNAGEFIGIRTSGYESIKKLKERPLLWERSAKAASEDVATPTITTIESLNGDETSSRTKSQSNGSSASKVSESSETKQEKAEKSISAKVKEASADVNTEPTEAQKEAGNYKKGHVQVGAFDITIEQPEGSIRRGTDADGKQWESKMHNTYGYIRGTEGVDGDHIDVFLSNDMDGWNGAQVFVVDQYNPDGTFDEHKVMLGFNDASDAKNNYLANYEKGWENGRRIDVSAVSLEDFEKWIASSHRKTKPFSEYKSVKPADDSETFKGHKAENSGKEALEDVIGHSLNADETHRLIAFMENTAESAPELELTPQNWAKEFGESGVVSTPIGEVKQGDNQYLKLAQQGRNGKLGMIKPTLEHPSVIIEDERASRDANTERGTSYVFIKTFVKKDGSRYYHFASITVSKEGKEVVISSQERSTNRKSKLLQQGKVTWIDREFSLHPTAQIEKSVPLNDSNKPTSTDSQPALLGINSSELNASEGAQKRTISTGKVSESPETKQSELKVGEFAPDAKAEGSVAALNTRFNNELQQQIDGNLPSNHIYQMGNPGKILLSTGVPDLPIQMNAKRLQDKATLFDHNFELYEVKDLVKALQNPLAVFSYGDKTKAQNIIVPLQKNGKNFIVGLSLNPTVGGKALEINSIRNVFPKDNSEWLNWISQGKALYLDKEKIQTLIAQQRTNLADVEYLDLDSAAKVVENFENPKPESKNDILFRDGDAKDYEKAQARETYERRVSTGMFQSREAIQDSMLSLKVAMDAIEEATAGKAKRIEDYDGFENAYLGENRLSSVNQAESAAFAHLLIRPMMEEVNRLAPTAEDRAELIDYMFAKHGLERNAYMRQQAAEKKLAEYKKQNPGTAKTAADFIDAERDYAGLTTLTGEADVSAAEAEAQRMVADYENDYTFHGTWNEIYVCRKKIC